MFGKYIPLLFLAAGLWACSTPSSEKESTISEPTAEATAGLIRILHEDSTLSIRGLHVLNDSLAWAAGSAGRVLRISGDEVRLFNVPDADSLEFRDIHAFDSQTAVVMGVARPAKFFRTEDGGQTWKLTYYNNSEGIFFDAFDFFDEQNGLAVGDPMGGKLTLLRTGDGGKNWFPADTEKLPKAGKDEGCFAASGTNICLTGPTSVRIVSGGTQGRVYFSDDSGASWGLTDSGLHPGGEASGIYSLAFADPLTAVAVGGDYLADSLGPNAAYSRDGGKTWALSESVPGGYKSCADFVPGTQTVLAVGKTGFVRSEDGGKTWKSISSDAYYVLQVSPSGRQVYFAGAGGRIGRAKTADVLGE